MSIKINKLVNEQKRYTIWTSISFNHRLIYKYIEDEDVN